MVKAARTAIVARAIVAVVTVGAMDRGIVALAERDLLVEGQAEAAVAATVVAGATEIRSVETNGASSASTIPRRSRVPCARSIVGCRTHVAKSVACPRRDGVAGSAQDSLGDADLPFRLTLLLRAHVR